MTDPATDAATDEPTEHPLETSLRTEWIVLGLVVALPLDVLLVVLAVSGGTVAALVALVLAVLLAGGTVLGASAVWKRWRYVLWDDAIEVRHGVIRHVATFVPFHRIQQIDVERGPLDRAFGIATLVVRTAAATTDAKVPGLDPRLVEDLRRRLLVRAGLDDAV